MTLPWPDLTARAAGLRTRLWSRADLARLSEADLAALAHALGARDADPLQIDRAASRRAADLLAILARWAGDRAPILALLFGREEWRSLRALFRGAGAGGLAPTRRLPLRALETLAELRHPQQLATLLQAWSHPWAPALLDASIGPEPDLAAIEAALAQAFLAEAAADARRGDRHLRHAVALERELHQALARRAGPPPHLTHADPDLNGAAWTRALLTARLRTARQAARLSPLSTAPLLLLGLRIQAEQHDLHALCWGLALGQAPATLRAALVSP